MKKCSGSKKANVKWIVEGDRNTKFFYHSVQQWRQRFHHHRMRSEDGSWIRDAEEIKKEAIHAFQCQLNGTHIAMGENMLDNIPPVISDQQNDMLCAFTTIDEIYSVINGMNMDSIAGSDVSNG